MPEPEERVSEPDIRRISVALHDLCQPLTTLQCRLELAEIVGTPEDYREAVKTALKECVRLSAAVGSMRQTLRSVIRQSENSQEKAQNGATE